MQDALGGHRRAPDPVAGQGVLAGQVGPQTVRGDDHRVVLGGRVAAVRQRRVRARGDDVRHARQRQDVVVAAAAALDVERVNRPPRHDREGVGHRQALVQPVGVERHLDVVLVRDPQRGVQRAGVGPGVLVHLEPADAGPDEGLDERLGTRRRAAAEPPDVDRPRVEGGDPGPDAEGVVDPDPPHRAVLLAEHRRHAGRQLRFEDPRREQVDVGVDAARRRDEPLAVDDGRPGADHDVDAVQGVRVAGPTDRDDPALADADRRLADPEDRVEEQAAGDDDVARRGRRDRGQVHAVPGRLAEADEQLVAAPRVVDGDLDDEAGVAEPDPVAGGRAVNARVGAPVHHRPPSSGLPGPSGPPPGPPAPR